MNTIKILLFSFLFLVAGKNVFSQSETHFCAKHKQKNFIKQQFYTKKAGLAGQENFDMLFVGLDLAVSNQSTAISGSCIHQIKVLENNSNSFLFELHQNLNVSAVEVNGDTNNFSHIGNELTVNTQQIFQQGAVVKIKIHYAGTPPQDAGFNSSTGIFNDWATDWNKQVTWTLSEPFTAYTWWPTKQALTDKIDSIEMKFTIDEHLKVGSNGLLVQIENLPQNKQKYTWKSNYPIVYYLLSFAVAEYQDFSFKVLPLGANDSLLIQNYIYDSLLYLNQNKSAILETGDMMQTFSRLFGKYPFLNEKYGHCTAPIGGGMEHQTMTTQGWFETFLTAHELGHQWWGNSVTCETWADIWINEGFASYSEYLYFQNNISQQIADSNMQIRHNRIMSQPGGSVYVDDPTNASRIFSGRLTYNKGAGVLHTWRKYIGNDTLFFNTLKKIQEVYKNKRLSTDEITHFISQETNKDFTAFTQAWIYGEGYPTYSGQYNVMNDTSYLLVSQKSSVIGSAQVYPTMLDIQLYFEDETDTIFTVENTKQHQAYVFFINKPIVWVGIDPNNFIINKRGAFVKNEDLYFEYGAGVQSIENAIVSIQNPVKNEIWLDLRNLGIDNLQVSSTEGKIIYSKTNDLDKLFKIECRNWAEGIYFLRFSKGTAIQIRKIVVE